METGELRPNAENLPRSENRIRLYIAVMGFQVLACHFCCLWLKKETSVYENKLYKVSNFFSVILL